MREETDTKLVQRSAQGDCEAYSELIRRYRRSLAALIRRLVDDPDDAEDVLQETVVQSWQQIVSVNNPASIQAWLLQVARNRCRDYLKSASRRVCPTEEQELESYVNRYGRTTPDEHAFALGEAVRSLSPAEQEVVKLFYLQDLTIMEICANTGLSAGTVKSRLFTARHHLRSYFGISNSEGE